MTKIKITWLVIALIALSLPGAILAQEQKTQKNIKLYPFYQEGILIGSYTEPFQVETTNSKKGVISFGYLNMPHFGALEGIFLLFYPDSDLYNKFEELTSDLINTKISIYQQDPSSLGVITSRSQVANLSNYTVNIITKDSKLTTRSFKSNPEFYNFISYILRDYNGQEDVVTWYLLMPHMMFLNNGDYIKFKTFQKEEIKSFEIFLGDEELSFKMPYNSIELLKRLIALYKSTK